MSSPPVSGEPHVCTEDCLADCPWCGAEVNHRSFHLVGCALGDILARARPTVSGEPPAHAIFSLKQCDSCWAMHESARLTRFCPACGIENHTVTIEAEASTGAALDVEALAEAVRRTALDHYAPEASASYARRLAKHYNTVRLAEQSDV